MAEWLLDAVGGGFGAEDGASGIVDNVIFVVKSELFESHCATGGSGRVRCERVARCEVVVLHPAKFGNGRVRYSGVAPCDLFLIILRKSGGNAKVDANVLEVSFAVPWIGKPKHPIIAPRQLSWMECACKSVESQNWKRKNRKRCAIGMNMVQYTRFTKRISGTEM